MDLSTRADVLNYSRYVLTVMVSALIWYFGPNSHGGFEGWQLVVALPICAVLGFGIASLLVLLIAVCAPER